MTAPDEQSASPWPRGYEEHKRQQLRRLAALPFAQKLEWLEEAQRLMEAIAAARRRLKQGGAADTNTEPRTK